MEGGHRPPNFDYPLFFSKTLYILIEDNVLSVLDTLTHTKTKYLVSKRK